MALFTVDITVEIEADDENEAWDKANGIASTIEGVVNVSEPEEAD